ncbi:ABC transporter permease, partial [Sedimentibacter sp.]
MNKFFYPKLAVNNIKKNSKTYIPYMLTCIGTIMMFYNICFLVVAKDIEIVQDSGSLRQVMLLGAIVIGIFSLIFLFYTNSFLIKKRKKEFGLFNILGMEKKHISKIMFFEALITSVITLTVGILSGILLSKLIILFLFKILSFNATFGFEISPTAIFASLCLFGSINVINFIFNITQVHLSKPVELLKGGNVGEKEPKTKWLLTIIGILCLGTGYYIAVFTESPLAALNLFFVAVILVIVGTYCLFTAGSIAILKRLRKNKKYYYKANHFISVSGMIYRMKQNAAGLSNICILSTMVIVMISSTISLYMGMEDILKTQYPKDIIVSAYEISDEEAKTLNEIINQQTSAAYIEQKDVIYYRSMELLATQEGAYFKPAKDSFNTMDSISTIEIITLEEFNRMENKTIELKDDECLLYSQRGSITENELNLNGYNITIKEKLTSLRSLDRDAAVSITNSYVIVVNSLDTANQVSAAMNRTESVDIRSYYYGFNIDKDSEVHVNLINNINS